MLLFTRQTILLSICLLFGNVLHGQTLTQTVRGKIVDQESRTALPGANVIVLDSNNLLGSTTDVDGNFRIDNVPVGRISLAITFIGYEDKVLPNILITSGKETVLDIRAKRIPDDDGSH